MKWGMKNINKHKHVQILTRTNNLKWINICVEYLQRIENLNKYKYLEWTKNFKQTQMDKEIMNRKLQINDIWT